MRSAVLLDRHRLVTPLGEGAHLPKTSLVVVVAVHRHARAPRVGCCRRTEVGRDRFFAAHLAVRPKAGMPLQMQMINIMVVERTASRWRGRALPFLLVPITSCRA